MVVSLILGTLIERLSDPLVIVGMVLCAIGVAVAILARRIAGAVRKTDDVAGDDAIMIAIKVIGLLVLIGGAITMVFKDIAGVIGF